MSRHVSRSKLSRKELVRKDEITSRLEQMAEYVWNNPQPFLWGAAVLVLGAAAVAGWSVWSASRASEAQAGLARVIQAYNDKTTFASDDARYEAALGAAVQVEEEYGGSSVGRIAQVYEALSHEGLGEADDAVRILEELAASDDPAIRPVAQFALGQSFKKQGEFDRAIALYQELLESGEYAPEPLVFELGQLNEAAEHIEEARTFYQSLLSNYPDSEYQTDAERALKRLDTFVAGNA